MTRKLNTVRRTATFAWSPGHQAPMIATGTLAGALDDSFSNASELEIFRLDLHPESSHLDQTSYKVSTNSRFNTLAWGHAIAEKPHGVIAGGMENGELELYDASAILDKKSSEDVTILKNSTHTGTLKALDFNLFQTNLLASAGSNSEVAKKRDVYIWDLNNPTTPYTPGARSAKMDDISSVAWNCQVQHILSTSSTNGYTVVWDLRNKKEVMTLAYAGQNTLTGGGRGSVSAIAWHPDVATQIVTASDDDQHPIISLWDLRHAHSPEKTLAGHSKGVLDVSWCRQDSDLLISSGKDCKTLCWNPNTGDLNGELSSHGKWTFAADWCPRNPDLLATASFDGTIDVLSIQGTETNQASTAAPVSDDPFEAALLSAAPAVKPFELKNPPKWLRRPVGASFGFSGKLVTFNNKSGHAAAAAAAAAASTALGQSTATAKPISRAIKISTIETDPEIVKRSEQLESATESESTIEALIEERIQAGKDQMDWEVLKTLFSENAREQLMKYLGFEKEQVAAAANEMLEKKNKASAAVDVSTKEEPKVKEEKVNEDEEKETEVEAKSADAVEDLSTTNDTPSTLFGQSETDGADDSFFGQVASEQTSPVAADENSVDHVATAPLIEAIINRPFNLYPDSSNETDRLITRSIVLGDFESAVNVCLASERYSDALLLAICGGSDLLARTQKTYFEHQSKKFAYLRLLEGIMEEDLNSIVRDADVHEWSSILVVLCTFAQSKEFGPLCQVLGDRLWEQQDAELRKNANLFYLAAGNLEKVSKIWINEFESQESNDRDSVTYGARLQELIEKVTIFRKAIDYNDSALSEETDSFALADLYNKYCEYAEFMATQGKLDVALKYISLTPAKFSADKSNISRGSVVRDRVYHANASQANQFVEPSFPFEKKLLSSEQEAQYQQQQPVARQNPYEKQQLSNAYQPTKSVSPAAQPTNYYAPTAVPTQYSPYGQQTYNQQPAAANVAYNNYTPSAATASVYGQQAQAYAPPQQQQYGQPQFSSPVIPAPNSNTNTPPPPPPKAAGAWNDPPMLPSPKMNKKKASPVVGGPAKRVTTPFANAPPTATYAAGPPQQQQQQQQQYVPPPPPMNATPPPPMRGLGGPPPPPSSNTTAGYYSAHQQFQAPPQQQPQQYQQQQQQFQAPPPPQKAAPPPPPPMNAVAPSPMLRGPPPQQRF
ncbi:hypothetical protein PS6_001549 [Mucor atramentarius]